MHQASSLIILYRKEEFAKLIETHVPKFFGFFEDALKNNSSQEFLVGDSPTIVDFAFLANYGSMHGHPDKKAQFVKTFEDFPVLLAYYTKREEAQREYIDNRPKCSI
jgi:glutathione S-transferase